MPWMPHLKALKGRHSSAWGATPRCKGDIHQLGVQIGYGGFSVSPTKVDSTISYIANQHEHHQNISFQNEYRGLLKKHFLSIYQIRNAFQHVQIEERDGTRTTRMPSNAQFNRDRNLIIQWFGEALGLLMQALGGR